MEINLEIKNKIINAANELVLEGVVSPTNEQVRSKMGKGSLSHISPVMREWRKDKESKDRVMMDIPDNLKLTIENAVSQVWKVASEMASAEIDLIKENHFKEIKEMASDRDEALIEVNTLEQRLISMRADLVVASQSLQAKIEECETLKASNFDINKEYLRVKSEMKIINQEAIFLKEQLMEAKTSIKEMQMELISLAKGRVANGEI